MDAPPPWLRRLRRSSDGLTVCPHLVLGESFRQRFLGLMGRATLPDGQGLYLPTSSIHMMFMRFPIDALFLGREDGRGGREVVGMREHLPPWRGIVLPVGGAQGVVELPAGTLARFGVRQGDHMLIEPLVVKKSGDMSR